MIFAYEFPKTVHTYVRTQAQKVTVHGAPGFWIALVCAWVCGSRCAIGERSFCPFRDLFVFCLSVRNASFFGISLVLRDLCSRLVARSTSATKFVYFENGDDEARVECAVIRDSFACNVRHGAPCSYQLQMYTHTLVQLCIGYKCSSRQSVYVSLSYAARELDCWTHKPLQQSYRAATV